MLAYGRGKMAGFPMDRYTSAFTHRLLHIGCPCNSLPSCSSSRFREVCALVVNAVARSVSRPYWLLHFWGSPPPPNSASWLVFLCFSALHVAWYVVWSLITAVAICIAVW